MTNLDVFKESIESLQKQADEAAERGDWTTARQYATQANGIGEALEALIRFIEEQNRHTIS